LCSAARGAETSATASRFLDPPVPNAKILRVGGDVEQPLLCCLATALDFQNRRIVSTSPQADTAGAVQTTWEGVPISEIVRRVRPRPGANSVVLTGADGTKTTIPLADLSAPRAVLAFKRDGHFLCEQEGCLFSCVLDKPPYKPISAVVRLEFAR
jgi:DMSO/TMAO reductase YedYZ molybdopterin-dependent catalytic subunit